MEGRPGASCTDKDLRHTALPQGGASKCLGDIYSVWGQSHLWINWKYPQSVRVWSVQGTDSWKNLREASDGSGCG